MLATTQRVILHGGLFADAMPRGSGKTSIVEAAALFAILYGHRRYVVPIGAESESAEQMLASIKSELANNELLIADFPEVCYPIHKLGNVNQRAKGQLYRGKSTGIYWTDRKIVLPNLGRASRVSGSVIQVAGITGRIRGMAHKLPNGEKVRPDLVLVDDPQTDESARSESQCATRRRLMNGAVLGLGGPGRKIAALAAVTVIREGDLADSLLDPELAPDWQGQRHQMLKQLPTNLALWDQYEQLRAEGIRAGRGIADATAFYESNLDEMQAGAVVSWPERKNVDEIDGLQHAMNLRAQDLFAFWAEFQNKPLPEVPDDAELPTAKQIVARLNATPAGTMPRDATKLTAFVDVQGRLLFYVVCAWREDFTGAVIAYGCEPEQGRGHFTLRSASPTLAGVDKKSGADGAMYSGLVRLCERLSKPWKIDGGGEHRIDLILIDANWGRSTDTVYQFCREQRSGARAMPAHGRYVGARGQPFANYKRRRGDRLGLNWRIPSAVGQHRAVRHIAFDTNYWKDFVIDRLNQSQGDIGALTLFGNDERRHDLLAEHLCAETRVKVEAAGRTVNEWKLRQPGIDNHWFDCLVGAAVAANVEGVELAALGSGSGRREKRRIKLSDIRKGRG